MKRITAVVIALAVVAGSAYLKAEMDTRNARATIVSAQQAAQARQKNQMPAFHGELLDQVNVIESHIGQDVSKMSQTDLNTWYMQGRAKISRLGGVGRSSGKGISLDDEMVKFNTKLQDKFEQYSNGGKKAKPSRRRATVTETETVSEQVYPVVPFDSSKR